MISKERLVCWLKAADQRYGAEGIPHKSRPLLAFRDFCMEHGCSFGFDHPIAKDIFRWIHERSPPGAHQIGSAYTGVFFYDVAFWPVSIPIIFGTVSLEAFECLDTMPIQVKESLGASIQDVKSYVDHWMQCVDYCYGHMDLENSKTLKPRAIEFLGAANSELKGANSMLLEMRPNVKAILGMRMATEIFLKAILIQEQELSDVGLRKISHNLEDAARRCADITGESAFSYVAEQAYIYPAVSARYENTNWPVEKVWQAARVSQLAATTVTRLYTDRDMTKKRAQTPYIADR